MLVSDATPGTRLSELLERSERREIVLDIGSACALTRQLATAVARLHARETVHGAIAAERIVITATGRLVLAEHVLGRATEQLRYSPDRYWKTLRVPVPPLWHAGPFDARLDLTSIGVVALTLFLGRRLHDDEYPRQVPELVSGLWVTAVDGSFEPLPRPLHRWLARAFEFEGLGFGSALEACAEFDRAVAESRVAMPATIAFARSASRAIANLDDFPMALPPASTGLVQFGGHSQLALPVVELPDHVVPATASSLSTRTRLPLGWKSAVAGAATLAAAGLFTMTRLGNPVSAANGAGIGSSAAQSGHTAATRRGQLQVRTDPAGAQVAIDGLPLGQAPLELDLATGDHVVAVANGVDTVTQNVTVVPGRAVTLTVPLARAPVAATSGWLAVTAPVEVQVYENGRLLGVSGRERIAIPAGRHTLEIVNGPLGYRTERELAIEQGKVAALAIELPTIGR
jgi:hypothetical protein